jgi:ribosome-associated protein
LVGALEDLKGQDIISLDVSELTTITDYMVVVSGTSNRHVKALVDEVLEAAKDFGEKPIGVEGREAMEWVLLDVGDVVVHVMQKEARGFYDLERLWGSLDAPESETH